MRADENTQSERVARLLAECDRVEKQMQATFGGDPAFAVGSMSTLLIRRYLSPEEEAS